MPPDPNTSLSIFDILVGAQVPFVIIGGHAVNFHGYVRTTEDADIIFERSPASEVALLKALQALNACWISNERDPQTRLERLVPVTASYLQLTHLMMLCSDLGFVDIYDFIPGFSNTPVREVFSDAVPFGQLRFISLPWLRRLKAAVGRHKDLDDLEHLQ